METREWAEGDGGGGGGAPLEAGPPTQLLIEVPSAEDEEEDKKVDMLCRRLFRQVLCSHQTFGAPQVS